jgi:Ca2+-binding RTX toxin-like protein
VFGAWTTNTFQSLLPEPHTWLVYSNETVSTAGSPGHNILLGEVWNLTGGPGGDTFLFMHANGADGRVKGVLDGGGPGAWLDYSQNLGPVTVNLTPGTGNAPPGQAPTCQATGVAGGVRNIQNVIGSLTANNALTGNRQSAVGGILIGGNGNDVLTAGLGRSILVAEGGASTLIGGGADDILIGGYTNYDHRQTASQAVNEAAWMAILAEWQRTDRTYLQRLHDLRVGGAGTSNGTDVLVWGASGTVHDNGAVDVLQGDPSGMAGDLDWFFRGLHDRFAVPPERGEHINNN